MSYSDPTIAEQRAASATSQNDQNQTSQGSSGSGAVIYSSSSARTSLSGGGDSGGGGGGGGGGAGGYSLSAGASLANTQTQSLGFSGAVNAGNKGFLNFGDFNANLGGGKQTNGLSATTLAILAGAAALLLLVLGHRKG